MPLAGPYVQTGDELNVFLRGFWQRQIDAAEQEIPDFRHPALPLARIKKVMKGDPDVKMVAADAPILFCKACEIFISEITARAFIVADSNKRRTVSLSDIAKALSKADQFDFLIDTVPRDELPLRAAVQPNDGKKPVGVANISIKQEQIQLPLTTLNTAAERGNVSASTSQSRPDGYDEVAYDYMYPSLSSG